MKKYLLALLVFIPVFAIAQASGGQIKRHSQQVSKHNSQRDYSKVQRVYNPVDMEPETYYMCINETWVVKNGQDLCRKMAAKGYDAELVKDPDPSMGYHVSVYKTKDKSSAINFYNNFKDDRWGIAYPFYDREYLPGFLTEANNAPNISPLQPNSMPKYSVVVSSYGFLQNAQIHCQALRDQGYSAEIYLDTKGLYRVVLGGYENEQFALDLREKNRETYPSAWILYILNGREESYNK